MVLNTFSVELQKFGFGDFIQGSYGLYEICRNLNIDFAIDLSDHPITDYVIPKIDCVKEKKTKIHDITDRSDVVQISNFVRRIHDLYSAHSYEYVRFYYDSPPENEKTKYECSLSDYFLPNARAEKLIKAKFSYEKYNLIHIRCGDHNTFGKSRVAYADDIISAIELQLTEIKNSSLLPILIISDSDELKKKLSELYGFCVIDNTASHTIEYNDFFNEVALDFFLICRAQSIHQFCVYNQPSGFSYWPHILFKIPFNFYNTISTVKK